jgi:hypothetical protein
VTWTVTNRGSATALGNWGDGFYLSNDPYFDQNDASLSQYFRPATLAPGESYTTTQTITIYNGFTPGPYYLLIVADASRQQTESDETNNVAASAILVSNQVDLVPTASTSPSSGTIGESMSLSWTARNQGNVPLTGTWIDRVYISNDATFDFTDTFVGTRSTGTITLAVGGNYTATQSFTVPSTALGARYLLFVIDSDQRGRSGGVRELIASERHLGPDD